MMRSRIHCICGRIWAFGKYSVEDEKGRNWDFVYDGSIQCVNEYGGIANSSYSVELNSPVLGYEDIPLLQEVIRTLRFAGVATYDAGVHEAVFVYFQGGLRAALDIDAGGDEGQQVLHQLSQHHK